MIPPETPLLAGKPTVEIQSPAESYMPQVAITLITWRATHSSTTRSSLSGCTPPLARVAAIRARSRVVTRTEHCRV